MGAFRVGNSGATFAAPARLGILLGRKVLDLEFAPSVAALTTDRFTVDDFNYAPLNAAVAVNPLSDFEAGNVHLSNSRCVYDPSNGLCDGRQAKKWAG